jgi:autoinducer 2-degrading protein
MIVNVVTIYVKSAHISEFITATLKNHQGTRQETGNHRFDVLRSDTDPGRFLLYEVFASKEAVEAHRQAQHYLDWKQAVEPWMSKPREPSWHSILAPLDEAAW